MHAGECGGPAPSEEYPFARPGALRVLRRYDAAGRIVGGRLLELPQDPAEGFDRALAEAFEDPAVALVHVRAVEYGCFHFEVRRPDAPTGRPPPAPPGAGPRAVQLVALGAQVQGAEARDDVPGAGRDVLLQALAHPVGRAGDDGLDLLQVLQRHAVRGPRVGVHRPAAVPGVRVRAVVDPHRDEQGGRDVPGRAPGSAAAARTARRPVA